MIKLNKDVFLDMVIFVLVAMGIGVISADWVWTKMGLRVSAIVYLISIPILIFSVTPLLLYLYYQGRRYREKRPLWQITLHILNLITMLIGELVYWLKYKSIVIIITLFIFANILFISAIYYYDKFLKEREEKNH